ncbi:MAG: CehA/McbA family metallohydrolase [Verrucomicrobiae bacterium]|nr:CehA/McbA family metallohydrolase [Verrucomicrobiae bacterium]
MNPVHFSCRALSLAVAILMMLSCVPLASGAESAATVPPGAVEFAGRLARQHWELFDLEARAALEAINRELREAQQQLDRVRDAEARRRATERASAAANRLLEQVKSSPHLVRVDLSAPRPTFTPGGPIEMPEDAGALLFEVMAGGEGVGYSGATFDLSLPPGESSLATLEVGANGTTYALLGLERLPFGRTTLAVEFRRSGQPAVRLPLDVTTPPPGRLKLTVLSDDTGKPAPAMVQLLSRRDGGVRQPANGIEFGLQFDKQGKPSGARNANLPGLADPFWCVPGPFDMTLPPGDWRIGVRRGVEHELVFEEVTIKSGETLERTYRPGRWVDMRQRGWWSGDDHVHGRILSDADARNLMAWIQAEDIHLANIVKMGDIYRTYFEQRGFGPNYRVQDGEFVLSPGQECPRTHDQIGHTLAMNITSMVRNTDRYFLYDEVFDAVHAQGGLSGYAHINSGIFHVHRDMTLNVPRQKVDFAEILQFNQLGTDLYYDFLNLGCKLTASSGSDVPWGGTVGEVRVYACLESKPFSADAWFEAFGRGRTFTTSGPMIEFRVDDALPGDEIRLKADQKLRIRARAWGDPKRMSPVKLEIVRHGEVIRAAESGDATKPEVELDFTVDAGFGCWIAARARGGDGTSAHTTPVYVVREGLRFWKMDGLDELFARRQNSLEQIEQLVADARRFNTAGKLENDRYRKQLALQGGLLLQRVAQARLLYEELKRTAEAERGVRGLIRRAN